MSSSTAFIYSALCPFAPEAHFAELPPRSSRYARRSGSRLGETGSEASAYAYGAVFPLTGDRKKGNKTELKKNYKTMLKGMQKKEEAATGVSHGRWFLYILECSDGTLYTGITKDLERRLAQHNAGTASRYTRVRRPVKFVYNEVCTTRTAALVRECEVKEMAREEKMRLYQIPNLK